MSRSSPTRPPSELSRSELDLLKLLWRRGRLSAREIHEEVEGVTGWAYTTTRTVLDRMTKKGLLKKEPFHRLFLYSAGVGKVATLGRLVKEFAERVLELDSVPVATLFADSDMLSEQEMSELERMLADSEDPREGEP